MKGWFWRGGNSNNNTDAAAKTASSETRPRAAAQDGPPGPQSPPPPGRLTGGSGSGGVIQALMAGHRSHAAAVADGEMERRVAESSAQICGRVWDGALALSRWLRRQDLRGASIVELGSGCGVCGLGAAAQGARVVMGAVVITHSSTIRCGVSGGGSVPSD